MQFTFLKYMKTIRIFIAAAVLAVSPVKLYAFQEKPFIMRTGIELLTDSKFEILKNKNIGLITNPTGVDHSLRSTIDIINKTSGLKLVALFSPEHGIRGDYGAGDQVTSSTDAITGLPVYSLYGKTRKATPEMLKGIDVLVYDIQDIGSRSYTFISTLGLAMEAAAENNIEFVVLDRPNPLGGIKMEGAVTRSGFTSFVSQFQIPYIHGLTVGELAALLNEEGMLKDKIKCKLTVIKMKGWKRDMLFTETGLPWVPSSPHIPEAVSAFYYPATGILGELYVMSIGVGYTLPFQLAGAPWLNADSLSDNLNKLKLPGIIFRPVHYKPYYSVSQGEEVHGVQVHLTDPRIAPLSLIQFYILQEAHKLRPDKNVFELCDKSRLSMFDKVCGTDQVRIIFSKTFTVESIMDLWMRDIPAFRKMAEKYFMYN
jgi:uncharacterized protein YbbC (DUF1343 family)